MVRRIIETTDEKYIGLVIDNNKPFVSPSGDTFHVEMVQNLGTGLVRYSNSHYSVLTKELKHG